MKDRFVLLLRHGVAEPHGAMPDEARALTEEGNQKMKEIARALQRILPHIDEIHSSPLLRCRQTATHVADRYGIDVKIAEELRPGAAPRELNAVLGRAKGEVIVCTGHEPTLTGMMLALTGLQNGAVELKKGGSYGVRIAGGSAALEWMLPPRVLLAG